MVAIEIYDRYKEQAWLKITPQDFPDSYWDYFAKIVKLNGSI